jgi:hypothetical protein
MANIAIEVPKAAGFDVVTRWPRNRFREGKKA